MRCIDEKCKRSSFGKRQPRSTALVSTLSDYVEGPRRAELVALALCIFRSGSEYWRRDLFPLLRGKGLKTGPGRGIGYGEGRQEEGRGGLGKSGSTGATYACVVLQDGRLMTGWWPMGWRACMRACYIQAGRVFLPMARVHVAYCSLQDSV